MRLDKFLKVSRLIRRRTLAKEVAEQGRVTINGNQAKASTIVSEGDEMSIRFAQKRVIIEVKTLKEAMKKDEAEMMYEVLSEEQIN